MSILKHNGSPLRYNGAPIYWAESSGPTPTWPTEGCLFAANFNNDLKEYYGNAGSWDGTASYDSTGFKNGNGCLDFSSTDSSCHVVFTDRTGWPALFNDAFSVSFWIKFNTNTKFFYGYISYGRAYGSPNRGWEVAGYGSNAQLLGYYNDDKWDNTSNWSAGSWINYVLMFETSTGSIHWYKNGSLDQEETGNTFAVLVSNELWFGKGRTSTQVQNALIGPTRIYDHVLSSGELTALYQEFD